MYLMYSVSTPCMRTGYIRFLILYISMGVLFTPVRPAQAAQKNQKPTIALVITLPEKNARILLSRRGVLRLKIAYLKIFATEPVRFRFKASFRFWMGIVHFLEAS